MTTELGARVSLATGYKHFPRLGQRGCGLRRNFDAELSPALEFCSKEEKLRSQRALGQVTASTVLRGEMLGANGNDR